jgi:hypothetical protein
VQFITGDFNFRVLKDNKDEVEAMIKEGKLDELMKDEEVYKLRKGLLNIKSSLN